MEQISLSPTGLAAIKFAGDLLIELHGEDSDSQTAGRWHDISVYRTDSGSLATCVAYRTQVPTESENCHVDIAEDVADVDNILSLYEPKQHVVMEAGTARNRVVDTVVRRYDQQVNEVLERLQSLPAALMPVKPR